jgi:hypothetical protein
MTKNKIMIQPGLYKHFKGNAYQVHFVAKSSENLEEFVAYEALYENKEGKYWVRPLAMFLETVEHNGKKVKRFEFISK